ncbi:lysostaphin resistance A-like protein [Emergencia sp.]|uniref:CPBP family intramembrane glutamic endopeptidase n=1 Tax=Emergencia sp. TaxID=1926557 RepID=UPI003AEFAB20
MEMKELEPKTEPEKIAETEKSSTEPDRSSSLGWKGLVGIPIAAYLGLSFVIGILLVFLMMDMNGGLSQVMNVTLWLLNGQTVIVFFLCRYLIRCNQVIKLKWRPARGTGGKTLIAVLVYSFAMIAFEYGLSEFVSEFTDAEEANEMIREYFQFGNIVLAVILVVIITPLAEEMLFRGTLFGGLRERYGFWVAAIISSAVFAVMHLNPWSMVCTFIIGMFYALLFEKTGSLVYSMVGHGINNLIAVISLAVPEIPFHAILGPVISAAAMALMVLTYIRVYKRQTGEELDIQVFKEDLSYVDEKYQRVEQGEERERNG